MKVIMPWLLIHRNGLILCLNSFTLARIDASEIFWATFTGEHVVGSMCHEQDGAKKAAAVIAATEESAMSFH